MRTGAWLLMVLWVALAGARAAAQESDLIVFTEDLRPYNYRSDTGGIIGLSTDRVRQVLQESGLSYEIRLVPWPDALLAALTEDNALLYTIVRTPSRQDLFDWLVPLLKSEFYVYMTADDGRALNTAALKAGRFRAVCVKTDVGCELFQWLGVPIDRIAILPNEGARDMQLVLAGGADMYLRGHTVNGILLAQAGVPAAAVRAAMPVDYDSGLYLAAGKQVRAEFRDRIRAAYERLAAEGRYEPIRTASDHE